jgi:signal transduction histidine kinase
VPLHRGGVVVGCLVLLLPAAMTAPTKGELTAWSALGAHASVALADERLREQAAAHAAELERHRLGRDLHDSVIAALFSLHVRAQAVRRGLDAGDLGVVRSAAQDLEDLSKQAVAELRAMVTDMRGRGSSSAGELPAALQELARACSERDGLSVLVRAEPVPGLAAGTAEHLLRITGEALHNCAKHAGASAARVELEVRHPECVLTVSDDGSGFDPAAGAAGGHGLRTMRERALLCGGVLQVDSAPGRGTRVVARIPLPAGDPPS